MFPEISVVIPVYNKKKYLGSCIDSVLSQTFNNFELILVDDGSNDGSSNICDQYAINNDRIKVIHKENGGVSSARNAGISVAVGKYITFVDSDDYIEDTFLEYSYKKITEYDADVFVSAYIMEYSDNRKSIFVNRLPEGIYTIAEILEDRTETHCGYYMDAPWAKLFKLNCIKDQIYFDTGLSWCEDTFFNLEFMDKNDKIMISDKVLYHYRLNTVGSLMSGIRCDSYQVYNKLFYKSKEIMKKNECSEESLHRLKIQYFENLRSCLISLVVFSDQINNKKKNEIIRAIANDDQIRTLKYRDINSLQRKLILFFLRMKCYRFMLYMFHIYFKTKSNNRENL